MLPRGGITRKKPITSFHESEEVNQVILFPLLEEALGKSDVASRKALHPSHTKALFSSLSSFISRQVVQDFRSKKAQGVAELRASKKAEEIWPPHGNIVIIGYGHTWDVH